MIVVMVIGLLAAIVTPAFLRARKRTQASYTLEDCRIIDAAKNEFGVENAKADSYVPKVTDLRPYLAVGSRLYNNPQLTDFRDIFGGRIAMGDLVTPPCIADTTRDYFSDVIPDAHAFWGNYCN